MHNSSEIGTDYNTNILLASASVFAFAGAAAAEVSLSGESTLGYNDNAVGDNDGFYWDNSITVTGETELDNGLTAGFSVTITPEFGNDNVIFGPDDDADWEDYTLYLESETAGLYFGDTATAGEAHWDGVDGSDVGGFDEAGDNGEDAILRGEYTYGAVTAALSYQLIEDGDMEGLQVAAVADLGNFNIIAAYQDSDNTANDGETFGLSGSTTFGGADVMLTYLNSNTSGDSSIGASVAYPVGAVTLGAFYTSNANSDDSYGFSADYADGPVTVSASWESEIGVEVWALEGSYDVGNGLVVYAGLADSGDDTYIAGTYDLGSGASLLVSYADDNDGAAGDEIGDPEYQEGTTVEVSFEF